MVLSGPSGVGTLRADTVGFLGTSTLDVPKIDELTGDNEINRTDGAYAHEVGARSTGRVLRDIPS